MSSNDDKEPQEVPVRLLDADGSQIAVFEFQGELRGQVIASFQQTFLATGNYLPDTRAVSPQMAMFLGVTTAATGATALSAALSSKLFMATADPATLMKIGKGVGSAVMGVRGIVATAPFIPIASSLPIVTPILAIQVLSTAAMMHQFRQVDRKLDAIKNQVDRLLARSEATHVGELLAASRTIDDVYRLYSLEGAFSQDMLIRLALADQTVKALAIRFHQLVTSHQTKNTAELAHHQQEVLYDTSSALLATFTELRSAYLRLCVDVQEHPKSVESSSRQLNSKIDKTLSFWNHLHGDAYPQKLLNEIGELQHLAGKKNLPKHLKAVNEKQLKQLRDAFISSVEIWQGIFDEFEPLIDSMRVTQAALEAPAPTNADVSPTLVSWQDETGVHSLVCDQPVILFSDEADHPRPD